MKLNKPLIVLLILIAVVVAQPGRRNKGHPNRPPP
jgi:hypothetical protein